MMAKPIRVQLSRRRGFRLADAAGNGLPTKSVARPSAYGNPFVVGRDGDRAACVTAFKFMLSGGTWQTPDVGPAVQDAARMFINRCVDQLRGQNLACWCPLDAPCHADVLLELANAPEEP